MNDERLQQLLQATDQQTAKPSVGNVSLLQLRRRLHRRRIIATSAPLAIAATIIIAISLTGKSPKPQSDPEQDKIAALQAEVAELRERTDAAMNLVQEVLRNERHQRQLSETQAQFASIDDPLDEINKQIDRTAFILFYRADRLYNELGDKQGAIEAYQQVIKLFSETHWAKLSQQRIEQINQGKKPDATDIEGDRTCAPKNSPQSC